MTKNLFSLRTVALMATVVLFCGVGASHAYAKTVKSSKSAKTSKMSSPDFAYPKTVEKNASAALEKAIAQGDWPEAVVSTIQMVTAENLVSRNNAVKGIAKIDSMASLAPSSWRPAFKLIEADIYNSIYNSIQWKANSRKIPTESIPENPYEWSRDIFALKIHDICTEIVDSDIHDEASLKDWNKFIENTSDAYANGMTINEFLNQRCFSLLNTYADASKDIIPFFPTKSAPVTPAQKCASLRDKAIESLIESAASGKKMMILAKALTDQANTLPTSLRMKAFLSAYDRVKSSEGEQMILAEFRDYIIDQIPGIKSAFPYSTKEYVELLHNSVAKFPKGMYANNLRNIINDLTEPSANIKYQSQYLSSDNIAMDVKLSNCNDSWVLVYDYTPYQNAERSPKTREVAARCRLVRKAKVSVSGNVPFSANATAEIGALPKGTYVVIPSATPDSKGIYSTIINDTWRQPFNVSDISVLTLPGPDANSRVFVVDGANGKPIEGAQVKVFTKKNYSTPRKLLTTSSTDKDGSIIVTAERFDIEASFEGSKWSTNYQLYNSAFRPDTLKRVYAQVLTNRALFHPGDSIQASIIAYSSRGLDKSLETGSQLRVMLRDANYKEVAVDSIMTDEYGRSTVDFKIPEQGLLGSWQLIVYDKNRSIGQSFIQIADYVAPTFFISADKSDEEVTPGDVVRLKGQVMTYSGMPVSGAKVKYNVSYSSPIRWYMHFQGSFDSSVTADAEGKYEIALPTANLKGTPFENGIFSVSVSATSLAGETQTGPTQRFAIGNEYHITPGLFDSKMDITDSIPALKFDVTDMLGRKVNKEIIYKLINKGSGAIEAEGEFMSPSLVLPSKKYPSALYSVQLTLKQDTAVTANKEIIFWRASDKVAPEGMTLWVPSIVENAKKNQKEVDVTVGSGVPDRWILAVLSSNGKIMHTQWHHIDTDNLSLPVIAPEGTQIYQLNISYLSDLKFKSSNVMILSPSADDKLQVKTESFRDKVSAGDKENWKFRFYRKSGNATEIPAMAVMTDAALNAITPFNWNFFPRSNNYPTFYNVNGNSWNNSSFNASLKNSKYLRFSSFTFPMLNDYGQDWGMNGGMMYLDDGQAVFVGSIKNEMKVMRKAAQPVMSTVQTTALAINDNDAVFEYAEMETADTDEAVAESEEGAMVRGMGNAGTSGADETPELRDSECPVAFFMPNLISYKDGIVDIEFTVPNFNTTWAFQLLGYDSALQVAETSLETVASKPVMISTHAPRFVRTGDDIVLTATVFNNSGNSCSPKCRIELVDLISGKTITSKDFNLTSIEDGGNSILSMPWKVPSNVSAVGFRAYAEMENHSDGEQALLPVLPASSPVVESTPFWIAPESGQHEVKLPKFNESDQVTLQYCDNPAWYCISALPDIVVPDSKSVTSKMKALFGNAVAYHLISSNANLKKGLEIMLSDSNSQFAALKSNLEKDGNLKITQLSNTPWVNNAESETLRMSRLTSLLNDDEANKSISGILDDISNLQDKNGGWSWCPDMQPSAYITRNVLSNFAKISKAGAMDLLEGAESMVKAAIRYVDAETVKEYKKNHKKSESLSYLLDWLYVRSSFPTSFIPSDANSTEMSAIATKARKDISAEWKDMGIGAKAKAAMLLWRAGDNKTSNEILESLRQYASETPEKGLWFDNLNSGWGGMSTLQTTTLVLEAFAEIQPSNKIVDSLRQWMVLGRQYQDWGKNTFTVETVSAILTSGTDWTDSSQDAVPEFKLRGKKINVPEIAKLTGAFTLTLNAKDASKKTLSISRKGSTPAWGGVISQFESPILEVVPAEVPELSIRKSVVALVEGKNGEMTPEEGITLEKGMKVRVNLFITVGRDMDYVAVTDERSACLEPIDQLSGYTSSDRIGFYREVRDANTNLFFSWLPKGTHVISYDCTVSQEGDFSCGIATIQSQYSPLTVAHSAGSILKAK